MWNSSLKIKSELISGLIISLRVRLCSELVVKESNCECETELGNTGFLGVNLNFNIYWYWIQPPIQSQYWWGELIQSQFQSQYILILNSVSNSISIILSSSNSISISISIFIDIEFSFKFNLNFSVECKLNLNLNMKNIDNINKYCPHLNEGGDEKTCWSGQNVKKYWVGSIKSSSEQLPLVRSVCSPHT